MRNVIMIYLLLLVGVTLVGCGARKERGETGPSGANGIGCEVDQLDNGAVITCAGTSQAIILNGINGVNGQDAKPVTLEALELISVCDMEFIRLENGMLIELTGHSLSIVLPGSYRASKHCVYFVGENMNVTERRDK
jgi:hypothetical protein